MLESSAAENLSMLRILTVSRMAERVTEWHESDPESVRQGEGGLGG